MKYYNTITKTECHEFISDETTIPSTDDRVKDFFKQAQDGYILIGDGITQSFKYEPTPLPTQEELDIQELVVKIAEAKAYLDSTDFKMTTDYDQDVTEVTILRAEARAFIRKIDEQ